MLAGQFDLVLGVTVLQHILDPDALRSAVQRIARHVAPAGRIVLLEAAPTSGRQPLRFDRVSSARSAMSYLQLFSDCGLTVRAITGVDPAPFQDLAAAASAAAAAQASRSAALAVATALSAPIDALFGRLAVERSWHAVFVLQSSSGGDHHAR